MPILPPETSIFPNDLLDSQPTSGRGHWWCFSTRARCEKAIVRRLLNRQIPFYCPMAPKRSRSPSGRIRTSYLPLFPGYVFIRADEQQRQEVLAIEQVAAGIPINDPTELVDDLQRIRMALELGVPMTQEDKVAPGQWVRVKSGPFRGYEGKVIQRDGKTRLKLDVRFIDQSVSLEIDRAMIEPV